MLWKIKTFFAKRNFMKNRGDVYEMISSNLSGGASTKLSTNAEVFDAWADREVTRGNSIGLIYRDIVRRLEEGGQPLNKALAPYIPKEEALIIEAGEAHGKVAQALIAVKKQKEATDEIKSIVLAALTSPAQSILNIAVTSFIAGNFLWPEMMQAVGEQYWGDWALPLIHFDVALTKHWQALCILFFVAWLYWWSIPRWTGNIRSIFDHIPPWSIYRDQQSAVFLSVLGGLLGSGMELDAALARVEMGSGPWLVWHVRRIRKRLLSAGANPLKALNTGLFSTSILDLIEDAARNRSFDQTLSHLGTDALPIIIKRVKTLALLTSGTLAALTGLLFMYQVLVQQIGVTDATNNFMSSQAK